MKSSASLTVVFHQISKDGFPLSTPSLSSWLTDLSKTYQRPVESIDYVITSDEVVYDLNKDHLDHDYYTDILTFPYDYSPIRAEVFISLDRARDNAAQLKITLKEELLRLFAHGFLHMCGFSDESEDEKDKMRLEENRCIALFSSHE